MGKKIIIIDDSDYFDYSAEVIRIGIARYTVLANVKILGTCEDCKFYATCDQVIVLDSTYDWERDTTDVHDSEDLSFCSNWKLRLEKPNETE